MTKFFDIVKIGRVLILVLSALFLLSACSNDNTNPICNKTIEGSCDPATSIKDNDAQVTCMYASVLKPIYNVIGATVMQMYTSLSAGAMSLVMIGFAVWLALHLLKFVSSVAESSPGEIWNEILKKAFICLFCGLLASSPTMLLYTINTFLFPIYEAFLEFGSEILKLTTDSDNTITVLTKTITTQAISCKVPPSGTKATLEGFPSGFHDMMSCMICAVDGRLNLGWDISWEIIKEGTVMGIVIGVLLRVIFLVVGIGFVFYFVDSIFRFGMMILLLPLFIIAYAFGPTKKWTSIGFKNIMNSAAFMMAFSIIIATTLMAITTLLKDNQEVFNPAEDIETAKQHMQNLNITLMCLLLIGFLVFGSLKISQQLTSSIIGGKTDAKFQENLKAVLQTGVNILTGGIRSLAKKTVFSDKTRLGRALSKGGALKARLNQLAGRQ